MASTSTSEQIFQYDVFLNHRGPDTKEQFLLPLIEKLREAGIKRPFLDQLGIHRGESVPEVILKALDSARMHIAVFSSSYAHSEYCLSELHDMLRTGRPIIPVFYDVKPEQVRRPRNPSGPFEEGFRKHLERQKREVVEDWEDAMKKSGKLYGFERDIPKYRGKDELLMKDIVDKVVELLYPRTVTIQPSLGQYDWMKHYELPTTGQGIIFFIADTYVNLRIAFSPKAGMVFPSYEIVIGLQDSLQHTRSEIRRHMPKRTVCSCSPKDLTLDLTNTLQEGNWHHFWICVDARTQLIYVGQGQDLEEKHAFIIFKDPSFLKDIQYFAFSSNEVAITYTGIRIERIRPTLFGSFGQDSSARLWSSIDASQVLSPSQDVNLSELAHNYGDYNWLKAYKLPKKGQGIVIFSVKTITDVHVAISPKPQTMDTMYEMVIGGWGNNMSSIQKKEPLCRVTTIGLIQKGENQFWMSINVDTQLIHVGQGNQPNLASVVCIYKDPYFVNEARYVSFFSLDANVIYSNILVASPSGTTLLSTQPFELPQCMGRYNQWNSTYKFSSKGQGILYFTAKARNDIHVAISPICDTTNAMYEIVIGGWKNSRSCIRRCSQENLLSYVDKGFIDANGLNQYWVSIDKDTKLIHVGQGNQANQTSVLFMCMDPYFLYGTRYIAFSTWDTPITYSSIAVSFQSATVTKPIQSVREMNQERIQWIDIPLQDPLFKVVISPNGFGHYEWQHFLELPSMGQGIVTFAAETITDVHVAISPKPETVNPMYEIVICGWNNSKSVIRRASQGDDVYSRRSSPISPGLNYYWVSIDASRQLIKVGFGRNPKIESSIFLWYTDLNFISDVRYVTFTNFDAPITYSSFAIFRSVTITKPIQSIQKLNREQIQWTNFQLQNSHLKVAIPPNSRGHYKWQQYFELPSIGQGVVTFAAETITDVHMAISPVPKTVNPMYEIVIGGWNNSKSVIRRASQGDDVYSICSSPIAPGLNYYWVSIDAFTHLIKVGFGRNPKIESSIFLWYRDSNFVSDVRYVTFTNFDAPIVYSSIVVSFQSVTITNPIHSVQELSEERNQWIDIPLQDPHDMVILSPNNHGHYGWHHYFELPSMGQGVVTFAAKTITDVHVAISPLSKTVNPMYEIVIGGWNNSQSVIRRASQGTNLCSIPNSPIAPGLNHYWVSIDAFTHLIKVGFGRNPKIESSIFLWYRDSNFVSDVRYVTFTNFDAPIVYSSIVVSFQSVTITNPIHSVQELSEERNQWIDIPLQDPHDMVILSPNNHGHYGWHHYFELPSIGQGVVTFAAETITDVHMAISPVPKTVNPMYEIVIGGWNNSKSVIRRASQGDDVYSICSSPIAPGLNYYWVSIDAFTHLIKVGFGRNPKIESSIFLWYRDSNFVSDVRYVTFTNFDAPIVYSSIVVSFQSVTITNPIHSVQELSEERNQWIDIPLQDPHDMVILSPNNHGHYGWHHYFELPSMGQGVVTFAAKTITDVHVAISPLSKTVNPMYEIVIGGWNNSQSVIRRASQGTNLCSIPNSPIAPGLNHYWVSIDAFTHLIKVGFGRNPKRESTIFLWYRDSNFISDARYVTFSNWDAPATYSYISLETI